jgi:hypothetical protein
MAGTRGRSIRDLINRYELYNSRNVGIQLKMTIFRSVAGFKDPVGGVKTSFKVGLKGAMHD